MKNKLLSLLLCSCMIFSLTACGSKNNNTNEQEENNVSANLIDYKSKVTNLADYSKITFYPGTVELTEDYLNEFIEEKVASWEYYESTDKKIVENGDVVRIKYIGLVDNSEVENTDSVDEDGILVEVGSGIMIDGFEEGLVGTSVGDTTEITLTLPDTIQNEDLQGKEITFNVTVGAIQKLVTPLLNEETVKEQGYDSLEEFEQECRTSVLESIYENYLNNQSACVIEYMLDNSEFNLDENEINDAANKLINEYYDNAEANGIDKESFLNNYVGNTEEMFEQTCKVEVEENIKYILVMNEVFEKENLNIDEIYENTIDDYATLYGFSDLNSLISVYGEDQIKIQMMCDTAMDLLIERSVPISDDKVELTTNDMPAIKEYMEYEESQLKKAEIEDASESVDNVDVSESENTENVTEENVEIIEDDLN